MGPDEPGHRLGWRGFLQECSGACGDLGTLIPHGIGAMVVAGLAPVGVLFGFGMFLVATGLFYGLPIPVQPMKAVSAVLLAGGLTPGEVAAAGLLLGAVLLGLGVTGAIGSLARLIPQSVTVGLQLGLGISLGVLGLRFVLETPWLGVASLALLVLLTRIPRCPAAPLMLAAAVALGWAAGEVSLPGPPHPEWSLPWFILPTWSELWRGFERAAFPQLALTLTNAIIVTAALAQELFGARASRASERNLAISTGLANLLLAPFGALPMCHGAGGLQAHYRFGARTMLAPVLLGCVLLVLALGFAGSAAELFAAIPAGAIGALLVVAGTDLAVSRRLFDARPSCWPVIGLAAAVTLLANPLFALLAGWIAEAVRSAILRGFHRRWTSA